VKATLVLEGKWLLSKQNSYIMASHGRRFKNPKYAAEQNRMIATMEPQLKEQKWKCTENPVSLKITFYGPCMPCDWDNCGILTDSMQGRTFTVGTKRYRGPGLVVQNDNQFIPVEVNFVKQKDRKIIVELEEIKKCG